jgi:DNA-binding response OmpR family regulator
MTVKNKILVVDDEPQLRHFIRMRLEANKFKVILASDGIEGLKKTQEEKPDLILLDILMPNLDGFGMLRKLKEDDKTKSIPVIILTAQDKPQNISRALEIGANDYMAKPFESKIMLEKIRKLL